jgi:pimeloyl-ACP methyl ester carboxylesterase
VLLVHGLLDSSAGWNRLAARLSQPCFVPDLPGFGASDMPRVPRLPGYADDVVEAVSRLGVDKFTLVGHSLGGAVAGAITDRYPGRLASLVLLAPAGFGRIRAAEALVRPGSREVVGRVLPFALANPVALAGAYMAFVANGAMPEAELLRRVVGRALPSAPAAILATRAVVAAGLSPDGFHSRRMTYDGPTRVVWGDRDRLVPISHLRGVHTALPQSEVDVWPGMGHHPQRERPDELVAVVADACVGVRRRRTSIAA